MSQPKTTEGYADFDVPSAGKPCQTWYKIVGDLQSSTRRPLIVLHDGPRLVHDYLIKYADLTSIHSIPVVLYDQLGNGRSTHLPQKKSDGEFWTDKLFVDEFNNLLTHLGIQDSYDLCGHSWGGMLAARHAVQRPKGLRHLILHSSPVSIPLWDEAQGYLRVKLPQEIQDTFDRNEAVGTTDSEEYKKAMAFFYSINVCKVVPNPPEFVEMFEWAGRDPTVLETMFGTDEFHTLGTLKDWSIIDEIHKINVTTLLVNGRDDTAQDKVVEPYFRLLQKVKWVQFLNSSHTAHMEKREKFMTVVGEFLTTQRTLACCLRTIRETGFCHYLID